MELVSPGVFDQHQLCTKCGYDLFGLSFTSSCPECGTSASESAGYQAFLRVPANVARLLGGAAYLLWASILSGFCPGACLLYLMDEGTLFLAVIIVFVFIATVVVEWCGENRFNVGYGRAQRFASVANVVAGFGLILVSVAAIFVSQGWAHSFDSGDATTGSLIGVGFFLLAATAWRAVPAYQKRA